MTKIGVEESDKEMQPKPATRSSSRRKKVIDDDSDNEEGDDTEMKSGYAIADLDKTKDLEKGDAELQALTNERFSVVPSNDGSKIPEEGLARAPDITEKSESEKPAALKDSPDLVEINGKVMTMKEALGFLTATGGKGIQRDVTKNDNSGKEDDKAKAVKDNEQGTKSMKQAKIPVYVKSKVDALVLRPAFQPQGSEYTRAVATLGVRCGTNLLKVTQNGRPAFIWPLLKKIKEDPSLAAINWKVDMTTVQRDPRDASKILEFVSKRRDGEGNQKRTLQNILIRFPEGEKERGLEFRTKWGKLIAQILNSPFCQSQFFGDKTRAYYAGDLTPCQKGTELPYLSDYLTIKHTIDALEFAYSTKTREEILGDDTILLHYFPARKLDEVRKRETVRLSNDTLSAYQDIPTFDMMKED